jgi:hypothetical protein
MNVSVSFISHLFAWQFQIEIWVLCYFTLPVTMIKLFCVDIIIGFV